MSRDQKQIETSTRRIAEIKSELSRLNALAHKQADAVPGRTLAQTQASADMERLYRELAREEEYLRNARYNLAIDAKKEQV
jgi:hypothetical protein